MTKKAAKKKAGKSTPKNRGGRPAFQPTEDQRRQVESMAGYGIPQSDIAHVLDIDKKTLLKYFRRELDRGGPKATAKVAQTLYRQAVAGNISAAIFWMKARAKWSERQEVTGADGEPLSANVTIYIPDNGRASGGS